jgi:hypothetical protein
MPNRRLVRSLRVLAAGALVLQAAVFAEGASAQCADPRGNAYCTNGGLVNIPNPSPPTNVNVQNPTGGNVQVQNPNPPTNVNVQNPNPPTNVNVQNPNPPTNVDVANPVGGDSGAQNPNAPIATAITGQLTVAPGGGAPGDMLAVSGQGFGANNLMFLNVIDSSGQILDTDSRAFSCTETDDFLLNLYQDLGWGCSSGARQGPLNQTNADGTFTGAIQIPAEAAPGPARLCAKGVFPDSCTPITISAP